MSGQRCLRALSSRVEAHGRCHEVVWRPYNLMPVVGAPVRAGAQLPKTQKPPPSFSPQAPPRGLGLPTRTRPGRLGRDDGITATTRPGQPGAARARGSGQMPWAPRQRIGPQWRSWAPGAGPPPSAVTEVGCRWPSRHWRRLATALGRFLDSEMQKWAQVAEESGSRVWACPR